MAVFNKKGGSQGGSGPLRWLPVGSGFNLLRLMFQSPGSPSGPFKNPAYKSYIAKISNEPLDFLMPDRSIVTARCVWIISGGRPSQHGFHLVIIANGRENLQKLTGQEGVSSRHFSADLIADAARADAAERSSAPIPSRQVTIKPKVKPVAKPVDDFSDLSGGSEDTTEKAVFPDEPARPAPKKAQATDLGSAGTEDEFAESGSDAGKLASTDLSDLDGGESLDFQKYESGKSKGAAAPKDDDFLSTPSEDELETSSAPSLIRSDVKVPQDTGFLSDTSDDPVMVQTGGRTWSLDDESSAAKPQPASEPPVSGDLLESTEPELEAPAEPEVPAEEELLPEEPEAPAAAEVPVASADDNPFGGEEPVLAAVSAPPVEAEPVPEDNPFEELDTKAAAVPEPVPAPAAEEGNPFEDLDAAPAASSPVEAELSGDGALPEESPAAASAPVDDTPGWDFSDDHPAAPAPAPVAAAPEPVKAAEPEAPPVSEPETDEFSPSAPAAESSIFEDEKSGDPFPVSAPAPASEAEEPVAMDDFSQEADQMAARVAGESDGGNLLEEPPAPVDVEPPRAEAAPAAAVQVPAASVPADEGFGDEPMFADETEAALGEAEALTDPEMLLARSKAKQPAVPSAPVQDDNAFAHDDVAYLDGLPKDAATAGDIRSAHVRQLDDGAAPAPSRFDELRAKGAPEAFDDEAVPVGDDVSDAEDIFGGENTKVTKLANSEFPEEAGNGRDMDSAAAADLRYTNFNTEEATAKAIAEADSIMSAEEFFKDEAPGGAAGASGPAAAPAASEPAPEPEPARAAVPETPAEPPAPVRPSGNWRPFTTEVSNELKGRAKQAKVLERAPDMLRFDLKVRVLWPGNDLTEGVLCVKDRAPSVYLSASDIRKIAPDAEVEF